LKFKEYIALIRDALKGKEQDYTKGSIKRALVLLSIPMIMEMVMEALFAVVDIYFVSKLDDVDAVATVGLTESVLMIIESVAIGIAMAATAMVARRIGEKDEEGASRAAMQSLLLGSVVAILLGLLAFNHADDILRMMGGSEILVEKGTRYTQIILGFNIVLMLLFLFNGIFRGAGNAAIAMNTLYLANGINIILDPCLIHGYFFFPELGLEGAAIASVIGRGVGVLFQIYILLKGASIIKAKLSYLKPKFSLLTKLSHVSAGGAGQFLISTASWIFLVKILAEFGSAVLAGYTIGIRVIIFTILPSWGMANATATLVGQNLGAGNADRAETTVWLAGKYNVVFLFMITIICVVFPKPIISFFTQDPETIQHGITCLRFVVLGYIFYAYQMVLGQAFNGAGDTFTPSLMNFFALWLFQIPAAYVLAKTLGFGPQGVYMAINLSSVVLTLLLYWKFKQGHWKEHKI